MNKVVTIIAAVVLLVCVWVGVSVIDVDMHNGLDHSECSSWNVFNLFADTEKPQAERMVTRYAEGEILEDNLIVTEDGHLWDNTIDNYAAGTEIVVLFNTYNTETVIDDEIIGYWCR